MSKHSPTPWDKSGDNKKIVAFYDNHLHEIAIVKGQTEHGWSKQANAAFIVRCVNAHEFYEQALTAIAMDAFMEPKKAWAIANAALVAVKVNEEAANA